MPKRAWWMFCVVCAVFAAGFIVPTGYMKNNGDYCSWLSCSSYHNNGYIGPHPNGVKGYTYFGMIPTRFSLNDGNSCQVIKIYDGNTFASECTLMGWGPGCAQGDPRLACTDPDGVREYSPF